jgi:poly(ADP-ribose) glycohydrolase
MEGCVQEEIRFSICPEFLISILFLEVLESNEAAYLIGAEQYSKYKGYASTISFDGDHSDKNIPIDALYRKDINLLVLDALKFGNLEMQFSHSNIMRELNKVKEKEY